MKKLFLLAATLFSMTAFAQEQGEDNGFGLKIHAGICGSSYGAQKVEATILGVSNESDWKKDENRSNKPLFGASMDNRWYVANPGNFGIAIDARWLDIAIGKSKWEKDGKEYLNSTNVQVGFSMPGVVGTFYMDNDMAIDAFYNLGPTLAVSSTESTLDNAVYDAMEDTKWGFGFSHFLGAAFRYKVFQVGAEYNFAHLKSVTWFEDDEDPVNNTVNSISETKTKFDNLRIFLGFKF
jgi:hypothetical protein